ncbi:exo-beta-N-acetylmuramidase NamZ domain-containing protein [Reichenbachiella sp. MSK19-1]|uniref:exo-beta-N-acetylmuramidase NamZ family protein n=1 Tax=Reichenbachiella sp. MSK19-1 TaxID=1897631 RepID=UPI000E6CD04A|nr:DUF1343 domain-containing protein [Reichenbachiella sp. MSK19-1]RJE75017.1 hypothetical protein BGP76_18055 [Reichenbachiella sp. MSK19-1]
MNRDHNIKKYLLVTFLLLLGLKLSACTPPPEQSRPVITGAEQLHRYLSLLQGKKIGLLVNHTSYIGDTHLLDTLLSHGIQVQTIFAPEHGFRGDLANGETVSDGRDEKTGLPVISLYGKNKKPSKDHLADLDLVIYDIQDVGARFYTYISSMHYMMEACADSGLEFLILDRPNPNGHYVDGPVLDMDYQSFVGMLPIPIVYGMTAGELAQMIVGEAWLETASDLKLTIIPIENWDHQQVYPLPIAPSPNLPNDQSINLYPSLCLFEGTKISVGRGTHFPFQVIGYPGDSSLLGNFSFRPVSMPGYSKHPKHEKKTCYGTDLRSTKPLSAINLEYIIELYHKTPEEFFNSFFNKLAGNSRLQEQILNGRSAQEIKDSWEPKLGNFKKDRKKYLLYQD